MSESGGGRFIERRIDVGELTLNVVELGHGPLVVLLHGFPEFWGSWRRQLLALADAGFRAVAFDMRGFHLSDKPEGVDAYHMDRLTSDVAALIRKLGQQRAAAVVGHDWGGNVAWHFAMDYPDLFERLVLLNMPHPIAMQRGLRTLRQLLKSWYIFFFQLPRVPERVARTGSFALMKNSWRREGVEPEDVERLVRALETTASLTGPINYYRSALRSVALGRAKRVKLIEQPTLVIWGEKDAYLGRELADPPVKWVPNARLETIPDASHWVQLAAPERVNQLMLDFLREGRPYREHGEPAVT
jgi:pimeloyl-ACP methyl ester carboxylesterase